MSTIVIMPGGFHPFHAGHADLYQQAKEAFPGADIYVAATNDQSERPFPFALKEKLAKLAGVESGHFVQVKSPFQAKEITQHYNPEQDVLIFVRSEKDRNEPPKPGGTKKDGSPAYFQPYTGKDLQPFSQHAYIDYLKTVEFGPGITSATQIRNAWPTLNDKRKTALVMSLYPAAQKNLKLAKNIVGMFDQVMGGQVDEGWKDVVAGGAMALGALGAGAQTMPDINVQQVELANKYYNVLVQRAKEDGIKLDTRTLNVIKAKAQDAAAKKTQQSTYQQGFSGQGSERKVAKDAGQFESQGVAEGLDEAVGGNYLYHATSASGLKGMLSSGSIRSAKAPQSATSAQTKLPTVSVTRDWGYASGVNAQTQMVSIGRDAILVLDRNAVESNFKTLGTSQSTNIKGLAFNPYLTKNGVARSQNTDPMARNIAKAKAKNAEPIAKAGGEFEEAVVVPKGALPLKGTMVGFWINPKSELMRDPAIMNDPRRLDMPRPNQFVKANQAQGVAEGASLSVEQLAHISDKALDDAYHYGRSTPGANFGWMANMQSAKAAKRLIDAGETDIEVISDAIHKGWNVTAAADYKGQLQLDTPTPEDKKLKRAKLAMQSYSQLPEEEKEKDRVVARALLTALRGKIDETQGLPYPSTYGQETEPLKSHGARRIVAMTNEDSNMSKSLDYLEEK